MVTFTPDTKAQESKENEIQMLIADFARQHPEIFQVSTKLFNNFIEIDAPSDSDLSPTSNSAPEIVTVKLGSEAIRATTRKPGNILFDWEKLFDLGPDTAIAVGGAIPMEARWLIPFVGLYVLNKLRKAASVDLQKTDALVLATLWSNHKKYAVSEQDAFSELKRHPAASNHPIDQSTFNQCVNRLLALRCIEMENGMIRLRERVKITYD
jgi:hypothetical protein